MSKFNATTIKEARNNLDEMLAKQQSLVLYNQSIFGFLFRITVQLGW
jgi:hypothetical protein